MHTGSGLELAEASTLHHGFRGRRLSSRFRMRVDCEQVTRDDPHGDWDGKRVGLHAGRERTGQRLESTRGGRVAGRSNSELEGEMRRGMPDRQWGGTAGD